MKMMRNKYIYLVVVLVIVNLSSQQNLSGKFEQDEKLPNKDSRKLEVENKNITQDHSKEEDTCRKAKTCEECVGIAKKKYECMWCNSNKKCSYLPYNEIVKINSKPAECEWSDARWGLCFLDFKAMVISVSVIGILIVLIFCCCVVKLCKCFADCLHILKVCCCWCCCCRGRSDSDFSKREERSLRRLEDFARRQERREQLMLKFNMRNNGGVPFGTTKGYEKFENNPI